jgi:hypothetical protein
MVDAVLVAADFTIIIAITIITMVSAMTTAEMH